MYSNTQKKCRNKTKNCDTKKVLINDTHKLTATANFKKFLSNQHNYCISQPILLITTNTYDYMAFNTIYNKLKPINTYAHMNAANEMSQN